jgi:hypothetical protein
MGDLVQCWKCGKAVPIGEMTEISEIDLGEQSVHGVVRRFQANCPDCGPFFHDRAGHHRTIDKKELIRLFPKGQRARLRNALLKDERKLFDKTLAGMRAPKDGELDRWLALQNAARVDQTPEKPR